MCINFATPNKALRGAVKFRPRFDADRLNQYRLVQGTMISTGKIVWHIAVMSSRGNFLTYV